MCSPPCMLLYANDFCTHTQACKQFSDWRAGRIRVSHGRAVEPHSDVPEGLRAGCCQALTEGLMRGYGCWGCQNHWQGSREALASSMQVISVTASRRQWMLWIVHSVQVKSYLTCEAKCWRGSWCNCLQTSAWEPLYRFLWPGSGPLLLGIMHYRQDWILFLKNRATGPLSPRPALQAKSLTHFPTAWVSENSAESQASWEGPR